MWILTALSALIMGLVLGLLGGGGSILAVPILHYLLEVPSKEAIAMSLLVVGTTSTLAAIAHARGGRVRFKVGVTFGLFAMGGAFLGGKVAGFIPGSILLGMFALLMLVTAIAMLRGKKKQVGEETETIGEDEALELPLLKIAAEGFIVGGVTGMVGAGGGFLVVPALVLLARIPMKQAIGTSLMVISMKSFAGFAGYAGHVTVDWELVGPFVGAAVVGTFIGAQLTSLIDAEKLRKGFAVFVLFMGAWMLYKELAGVVPLWSLIVGGGVVAVGTGAFLWKTRQPDDTLVSNVS